MKRTRHPNNRGVTLPESLLCTFIVAITLTGALWSFIHGRLSINSGTHYLQAINIASLKMEELKNLGYDNVAAQGDQAGISVSIDDGGTENEDFNFNGVLDEGEDLNGNTELDLNTEDDLLGTMDVDIGAAFNMWNDAVSDADDAVPVSITVTWQERGTGGHTVVTGIESFLSKKGGAW
jgi:hypothetical protein